MGNALLADDDGKRARRIAGELGGNAHEIRGRCVHVRRIELHLKRAPGSVRKLENGPRTVSLNIHNMPFSPNIVPETPDSVNDDRYFPFSLIDFFGFH